MHSSSNDGLMFSGGFILNIPLMRWLQLRFDRCSTAIFNHATTIRRPTLRLWAYWWADTV